MDSPENIASFLVFLVILIGGLLLVGASGMLRRLDRSRIKSYFFRRGGRLKSAERVGANWSQFFSRTNERLYALRYVDADGHEHAATCKTSLSTGVYFTDDRIVCRAQSLESREHDSQIADLRQENRRLREELERLKTSNG